jgi:hypothetical protein
MDGASSTNNRDEKSIHSFVQKTSRVETTWKTQTYVYGRIISNWTLEIMSDV